MSEKTRKKKDGERKDKKNERMREDVKARHEAGGEGQDRGQGDNMYQKKKGKNLEVSGGGPDTPGHG
jgi:hypothetical protein